jgi:sulfur carrier protein ThiS
MKIHIELCSFLRKYRSEYDPNKGIELEVDQPLTVAEAAQKLGIPVEEIQMVLINHDLGSRDQVVEEGDSVGLYTVLVGG